LKLVSVLAGEVTTVFSNQRLFTDSVRDFYAYLAGILSRYDLAGEEAQNPVDPESYNEAPDAEWLPQVRQKLSRRYPAMHRGYGRGGYGALYAITPDWHPIIDRLPGLDGAFCAVGFSGHGFKMSPIVGQLMAELVVDGQARVLDVTPLRLARFEEKDPVKTPYAYGVMG